MTARVPRTGPPPVPASTAGDSRGNPGLWVLAALGFMVLSVLYIQSSAVPGAAGRVVADLAFLVPIGVVLVLSVIAHGRSRGLEARLWGYASALYVVLAVSELYYAYWLVFEGGPPPPIYAPFQVLHVLATVASMFLLAAMTRLADAPTPARARWFLDVGGVAAVVYVLSLKLIVEPLFAGIPGTTAATRLIAAAYPTAGLLVGVGALWTLVRPGLSRWRLWERLIALSMVIYAAGTIAWPIWYVAFLQPAAATDERSMLDLILVLGHYLFMLAAAERLLRPDQAWPMREEGPVRRLTGPAATYIALGIAVLGLPAFVAFAVRAEPGSLDRLVFGIAAGVIALLTVARTVVTAHENGRLFDASMHDALTGLPGHRQFHERLAAELELSERFGEPLSVVWADVDAFARFNRAAGLGAGDEALQDVAAALRAAAGASAIACRVGGDEFAIIARGADPDTGVAMGELARAALSAAAEGSRAVTVSVGVACYPDHGVDAAALVRLARGTAYWARLHGADRVLLYEPATVLALDFEEHGRAIDQQARTGTVRALVTAADARLEKAGTTSAVVAELSVDLARRLGFSPERIALLETAALLHDVGMIALGDDVLTKPGPLTEREMESVRRHPRLGERIAGPAAPEGVGRWIRHHHERWDGSGYPDGLRAAGIPLESRILAVCDAWAAMTSERPYRAARTAPEAEAELRACAATQFDPAVVEALVGAAATGADERAEGGAEGGADRGTAAAADAPAEGTGADA